MPTKTVTRKQAASIVRKGTFEDLSPTDLLAQIEIAQFFHDTEQVALLEAELDYRGTRLSRKAYADKLERA
jgi:hypothetical protein